MTARRFTILMAAALVLAATAACDRVAPRKPAAPPPAAAPAPPPAAAAPALTGFRHAQGLDLFGYYEPDAEVTVANYTLEQIHIGGAEDFEAFERGQRVSPNYAPIMLEFADVTSPQHTNELGGSYYETTRRVLPDAYEVTAETIRFHGRDEVLGEVVFEGRLDRAALQRVQASDEDDDDVVLKGVLTVMRQRLTRGFTWFGGD